MHARSLLKGFVLALCSIVVMLSMAAVLPASPPPPPSDLLKLEEPHEDAVYHVGDEVHIQVSFKDGTQNPLYKDSTQIDFIIQKRISMPDLNEPLGSIDAQELYANGSKFTILENYLIPTQRSIPFRVRAHFDGPMSGYDDSGAFQIREQ